MFARPLALASLLHVMPFVLTAQEFGYAPGRSSYRMVVKSNGVSETNGVTRPITFDAQERLTLTVTSRARDTLALEIVLDSATIVAPAMGVVDASNALGLKVSALLSPRGRIYSRVLPELTGREAFTAAAEEMARFLPVLPEPPRLGLAWSDTTSEPVSQLGIRITRTRIVDYTVAADTLIGGERAWRIDRRAQTRMEGAGEAMGTPIVFRGDAVGSGAHYVGHSGRYLGAALREEVKSKVTLSAINQVVDGTQTQTTVITLVP